MGLRRIDIIGAGISGLTTAYYLARAFENAANRIEIHVWEKDQDPGGLAGTFTTENFTVEKFYHHIYRRDYALQDLIEELGLGAQLIWRPAATGAYYFQQPYRLSSPVDVLRFKPLPLLDRLRLGWMAVHAKTIKDWRKLDDMSSKEYIHNVAGGNVYRVVWEPLFRGKFGSFAESVSAAWLWSKLVDRGGSRNKQGHELLGYLRGGMGRVFEEIINHLKRHGHHVHLGQAIQALQGREEGLTTIVTDEGSFTTDLVVGCAQLPELAELLPNSVESYRNSLHKIDFLANVCLVLTLKHSLSDFYWTNVTEPDAPFVGIIEQTNWAAQSDFNHKHIVYISAYVNPDDPRLAMDAAQLIEHYLPSLNKLFPAFEVGAIEAHALWQTPYAQPIVRVGYRFLIPEIASPIPNFLVCTMAQIYPHDRQMSNGVALARKTVALIRERLA